jgi:L-fucose isomerase-like protein
MTAEKKLSPENVEHLIRRLDKETNIEDELFEQIEKLLRYAVMISRRRENQISNLLNYIQMTMKD